MYICIYIYIEVCIFSLYVYIEREKERNELTFHEGDRLEIIRPANETVSVWRTVVPLQTLYCLGIFR